MTSMWSLTAKGRPY